MNQSTDLEAQTARFTEAVRAFTPVCASRFAKLLPFKDGIVELRQKGASYRLIRELLATVGTNVALDTIGHFVREVVEQRSPVRAIPRRRPVRPLSEPSTAQSLPTPTQPQVPFTVAPPSSSVPLGPAMSGAAKGTENSPPIERPRTRGPRIANPSNL